MMGRTHSVHAEPTTFGLKLAGWAFEVERGRARLAAAVDEIGTGKISGPVGTYSHLGPEIEAEVLAALGLHADPVSTQIVQRDRHAALLTAIAIVGGSLERFATEIRNLQHTEIGELQEPFQTGQKGSSAMPHKRNPILSERIAGLARLLRGYAHTALEDQPLWHERDISHSSAERVILPDATILLDYMLVRMTGLVDGLLVRSERMRENIARGLGLHASSNVLVALVDDGGLSREDAYAIVQRASLRAADERSPLRDLLAVDPAVAQRLSLAQLDACFDDATFLRHVPEVIARLDGLCRRAGGPHRRDRRRCPMLAESFLRSGKVRDLYMLNDGRLAARRLRPDQRLRRRAAVDDPGQGPGPDRPVAVLVRGDRRDRPQPPAGHRSAAVADYVADDVRSDGIPAGRCRPARRSARPHDDLPAGDRGPDRGRRPRLPRGVGLEGVPGDAARSAGSRCRRACARATACRSRSSRRRPRPSRVSTTRTSASTA